MGFRSAFSKAPLGEALTAVVLLVLTSAAAGAQPVVSITGGAIANPGASTTVDLSISGLSSAATSVDLEIHYTASVATATAVVKLGTADGGVAEGCEAPLGNESSPGVFSIGFTCINSPNLGNGAFLRVTFVGNNVGSTMLTVANCFVDESTQCGASTPSTLVVQGDTATPTNSPTLTPTNTASPTATLTPSNTPTATATDTFTIGPSPTPTNTPTVTPTGTSTPTRSSTPTTTPTVSSTPTRTPTVTRTETPTRTITPTATDTQIAGPSATRPPIPVVPSPVSPAGLLMIGALGAGLLWALRRIGARS